MKREINIVPFSREIKDHIGGEKPGEYILDSTVELVSINTNEDQLISTNNVDIEEIQLVDDGYERLSLLRDDETVVGDDGGEKLPDLSSGLVEDINVDESRMTSRDEQSGTGRDRMSKEMAKFNSLFSRGQQKGCSRGQQKGCSWGLKGVRKWSFKKKENLKPIGSGKLRTCNIKKLFHTNPQNASSQWQFRRFEERAIRG